MKGIVQSTKGIVVSTPDESAESFAQRLEVWAASLEHAEPTSLVETLKPPQAWPAPSQAREWPVLSKVRHRRKPWGLYAVTFAVAALTIFAALGIFRKASPVGGLDLRADTKGESVLLTWNRLNPIVHFASSGKLDIDDGTQHREVHLDAEQIANGSILYRPASDDVTFRIEFGGDGGEAIRQTIRVLDGAKRQPVELGVTKAAAGFARGTESSPTPTKPARRPVMTLPEPVVGLFEDKSRSAAEPSSPKVALEKQSAFDISKGPLLPSAGTAPEPLLNTRPPDFVNRIEPDSKPPNPSPPITEAKGARSAPLALPPGNSSTAYLPPRPLRQFMPNVKPWVIASPSEIEVELKLDKNGHVEAASLVRQEGKFPGSLAGATLAAARQWTFKPAMLQGVNVESSDRIIFRFHPPNP